MESVTDSARRNLQQYHEFLNGFTLDNELPHYHNLINDAIQLHSFTLPINLCHVYTYNPELYRQTLMYPDEVTPIIDEAIDAIVREKMKDRTEQYAQIIVCF
jgi:DNA replicative helicase MCM subunit Mcm2 (Cdc46/Mcm family)